MADSDRLRELRRQRTLVAGHLAWLDQEIDRSTNSGTPVVSPPAQVSTSSPAAPISLPESQPDELINQWVEEDQDVEPLVSKTGCWLVFAAAILLSLGAVVLFIVLRY